MAAEGARRESQRLGSHGPKDLSYTASEIYEPDWSLSPFPHSVVGTFSCHGIEPSYFTDGAMAKINQDRGCIVQPRGGGAETVCRVAGDAAAERTGLFPRGGAAGRGYSAEARRGGAVGTRRG